jgi:hypothetical protein
MLLWALVMCLTWPAALSFADEVGYVGQAKLLLAGHVRPHPTDPGLWIDTPHGPTIKYPLLVPFLFAPLVAVAPRLVFASGIAAALAITWLAGRALRAWGRNPAFALVVLLHPTVALIARTAMADLPLAAFALGGWWALRRDRRVAGAVALALTVPAKPTGFLIALALVAGEALVLRHALLARERRAVARVAWAAAGFGAGLVLAMALNLLAAGKLWFGYSHDFLSTPPFWYTYFPTAAPRTALSLLALPPLLIAGAWPFWRRRDAGPLLLIGGLGFMMCFYFFNDTGRTALETLVLAPRLLLPVIVFLLLGYADLLAGAAAQLPRARTAIAAALLLAPAALALAIAVRHRRWQEPERVALESASRLAAALGSRELGLTPEASKVGILYRGRTTWVRGDARDDRHPPVVLCAGRSWSYRTADTALSCRLPGYDVVGQTEAGFELLVRKQPR